MSEDLINKVMAEVMKKMIQRDAQGALTTFLQQVQKAPDLMGTLSDLFGMEYADDIAKLVVRA